MEQEVKDRLETLKIITFLNAAGHIIIEIDGMFWVQTSWVEADNNTRSHRLKGKNITSWVHNQRHITAIDETAKQQFGAMLTDMRTEEKHYHPDTMFVAHMTGGR